MSEVSENMSKLGQNIFTWRVGSVCDEYLCGSVEWNGESDRINTRPACTLSHFFFFESEIEVTRVSAE